MPPAPAATPTAHSGPIADDRRIAALDIARGFALFGILVMNLPGFSTSLFADAATARQSMVLLDRAADLLREGLFAGKFNGLFGLLFGIGFTLQLKRMDIEAPGRAGAVGLRRMLALLAFALLHALLLWTGDVLHVYALLGMAVLLLRRASDRTIAGLVAVTLCYPAVADLLRDAVLPPDALAQLAERWDDWVVSNNAAYGHGSFADAAREHVHEFVFVHANRWSLWSRFGFVVQMATTVLIGMLIGRHGGFASTADRRPWPLRRWQALAFVVGVAGLLAAPLVAALDPAAMRGPAATPARAFSGVCSALSRVGLTLFYALTVVRLAQRPGWRRRLAPLADAGRMPLSNYVLQTLLATALFYGWGFGLGFDNPAKPGPTAEIAIAAAIFFGLQLPLSVWWLRRFGAGPLERVWRRVTYG